jgi:large conductance mechanosensitive channel
MWKEFKAFILRGNVIDLAVAVVIGAAFTAIVNSIVADLITPLIGLILGGTDFSQYNDVGPGFNFGNLLNAIINFLVVGVVLFFVVKAINKVMRKAPAEPPPPAPPTKEEVLLAEIRDILAKQAADGHVPAAAPTSVAKN